VHRRLRLLAFPPRTIRPEGRVADLETSRFPSKERPYMPELHVIQHTDRNLSS